MRKSVSIPSSFSATLEVAEGAAVMEDSAADVVKEAVVEEAGVLEVEAVVDVGGTAPGREG